MDTNNDSFFPEDYNLPTSGGEFMKLEKGESLFRILGKAVMGWEYWTEENKPVRSYQPFTDLPANAKKDKDGKVVKPKHIWILPVYDYTSKAIRTLTISQKKVQEAILNLVKDPDWGAPTKYDIRIVRDGDGLETKYSISPKPHKEMDAEVMSKYAEMEEGLKESMDKMFS